MCFTIEELNHVTGARSHRKATKYEDLVSAMQRAAELGGRVRKFVTINVLDCKGNLVSTVKGTQ